MGRAGFTGVSSIVAHTGRPAIAGGKYAWHGAPDGGACFTAPATVEYLEENLDALRNPALPDDVREKLLKRGEWMYREDTVFRKTVRAEV